MRVLFLCTGNYYRSRLAEELLRHSAEKADLEIECDSAGLGNIPNPLNPGPIGIPALLYLQTLGISSPSLLRYPKKLTRSDLQAADLVVCMNEPEHRGVFERHARESGPAFPSGDEWPWGLGGRTTSVGGRTTFVGGRTTFVGGPTTFVGDQPPKVNVFSLRRSPVLLTTDVVGPHGVLYWRVPDVEEDPALLGPGLIHREVKGLLSALAGQYAVKNSRS